MNAAAEGRPVQKWTWLRWLVAVAIVFVLHLLLLFLFSSRKAAPVAVVKNAASLTLANRAADNWLALNNATLFALPNSHGFAALMWIEMPPLPFKPQNWTEDPQWLPLTNHVPATALGASFDNYVQTNQFTRVHFQFNMAPPLAAPIVPIQPAQESTMEIEGELARRPLLNQLQLPSWPFADVIAPSVVQVLVDEAGRVVSATLMPPPDNFLGTPPARDPDADLHAVALARSAHFAPLKASPGASPSAHLSMGQIIFNWQTVPVTTKGSR